MAKFRQYKNGIFGWRYKGYYIIRNNSSHSKWKKWYRVVDRDNSEVYAGSSDIMDCEWFIDRMTASDAEIEVYKRLYECDIPQLHRLSVAYSRKTEDETITKEEKVLYKMILKIRDRKAKDKPYAEGQPEENLAHGTSCM